MQPPDRASDIRRNQLYLRLYLNLFNGARKRE
jgi:hypothetical protein